MKFLLRCTVLLLLTNNCFAQFSSYCKDTLRQPDTYFQCHSDYEPVCGCDQVTYRNSCAAYNWGGLYNDGFNTGWIDGICGNFDFDFTPLAVEYFPVKFSLYMKSPGSASLYIYNRYGGLMYADYFSSFYPDQKQDRELNLESLDIGIYFAVVVVNGEKQFKKFGKVNNTLQ